MIFLKIAFFNIIKHGKRTLVIMFAVTVSVLVMELASGLINGIRDNFFTNVLQNSGHLQIHASGFRASINPCDLDLVISQPDHMLMEVKKYPEVVQAEKILSFEAKLINADKNVNMIGQGTFPDSYFFAKEKQSLISGSFLESRGTIALSNTIVGLLGLKLGDDVIVVVNDSASTLYYLVFKLSGIFHTGSSATDDYMFFINHADAEELLYLDNATKSIRIQLADRNQSTDFCQKIAALLKQSGLEAQTWQEQFGSFIGLIKMMDFFMLILNLIIIIVAATVIINAILMAIFQRFKEFGTMRAIGLKKRQVMGLILTEGFLLGIFGSLVGLALGIPLVLYLHHHGLNMGKMTEAFKMGSGTVFYFGYSPLSSLINFTSGIMITFISALYSGFSAYRKTITQTLNTR